MLPRMTEPRRPHRMPTLALPGLEDYAEAHSTPVPAYLAEVAAETVRLSRAAQMMVGPLQGQFMKLLVQLIRPQLVVEIGTFTGYSALAMAAGLPPGGRIVTLDVNSKHVAIARRHIAASPYADRIEVREGPALDSLRALPGPYDFIFIDADKTNYANYYEEALAKLSPRGLIAVDNVLWTGRVLEEEPPDEDTRALRAFNDMVAADPRVECVLLTVRDGLTLIWRQ